MQSCEEQCLEEIAISQKLIKQNKTKKKKKEKKNYVLESYQRKQKKKQWDGMCSCFYLRLSKQLVGGLGARLADEVSDMIVRIKRGLSRCCYSQPPEPPGTTNLLRSEFPHMSRRLHIPSHTCAHGLLLDRPSRRISR